jgi:hypothetical protein
MTAALWYVKPSCGLHNHTLHWKKLVPCAADSNTATQANAQRAQLHIMHAGKRPKLLRFVEDTFNPKLAQSIKCHELRWSNQIQALIYKQQP